MRYPKNLKKSIAFIAPSCGCASDPYKTRMENAYNKLSKDYDVTIFDNCNKEVLPYRSNTANSCALEFINAYSGNYEVLMSVGGGEYMVEILDYIDFNLIKQLEPTWFMGYSDNTNLTFLLPILCDVATIYGPNAPSYGYDDSHKSLDDALDLLSNKSMSLNSYEFYQDCNKEKRLDNIGYDLDIVNKYYINKQTKIEGRLIGGCLDVILSLIGTKYDKVDEFLQRYSSDGFIWFLEACDLTPIDVKRAIKQMENANYFQYVKGFVIGKPLITEESYGVNHIDAYLDILNKYNVVIVGDADLGHVRPSMPLVCGAIAQLETKENKYSIKINLR